MKGIRGRTEAEKRKRRLRGPSSMSFTQTVVCPGCTDLLFPDLVLFWGFVLMTEALCFIHCSSFLFSDTDMCVWSSAEIQLNGVVLKLMMNEASDGVMIKLQMLMSNTMMCSLQAVTQKTYTGSFKRQQSTREQMTGAPLDHAGSV